MFDEARIKQIKRDMNMWRMGFGCLPTDYIALHEEVAREDAERFAKSRGVIIGVTNMISDGWMDGMRVLQLECQGDDGKDVFYTWNTANGGSWFESSRRGSAGGGLVECPACAPGHL
jgi:valyl-tRNA synthetase